MNQNNIIFYQSENENVVINVIYKDETFWLTQKAMAELFDVNTQAITKHLQNIYEEQELSEKATCSKMEQVQQEGNRTVKRNLDFYNLDAIIAVGYRVNSKKAAKFRQWATKTLKEYITKGFVLNEELIKNGKPFGKDYFDELLEKIREIRASERRAYQKITDIFEQCSCDYDKNSETTKNFYASSKINCIMQYVEILRRKLSTIVPTLQKSTWGLQTGKIRPTEKSISPMLWLRKII